MVPQMQTFQCPPPGIIPKMMNRMIYFNDHVIFYGVAKDSSQESLKSGSDLEP